MKIKDFETMLDRWGSNLSAWPAKESQQGKQSLLLSAEARASHDRLTRLEIGIAESRPDITPAQVSRVIARSLSQIAQREARPSLIERLRLFLLAPIPRFATGMALTAIGFTIGIAIGNPDTARVADSVEAANAPLMMASADDVPY